MARPVLKRLAGAEVVVIGSGSCGAMLKVFYRELFAGEPEEAMAAEVAGKVWEFSSFLVDRLGVTDVGARFARRVTFHDGCHGLRELRIKSAPRVLLGNVRDLELVEMSEAVETCCGFGGTFATKHAAVSTAMGEVKCAAAVASGAEVVVSNDASCLMHLRGLLVRQGVPLQTLHLAEVLVQSELMVLGIMVEMVVLVKHQQ
jgi:L-lactate dehydrogenase complex protein LldE